MLTALLPDFIDPRQLAERGVVLNGRVALGRMPRLGAAVAQRSDDDAAVELRFERDAGGRRLVAIDARADVLLHCERCLGIYRESLAATTTLAIVESEAEAEQLPAELDPMLDPGRVRTADVVEDELILALPLVPKHRAGDPECVPGAKLGGNDDEAQASKPARENPFAVLAKLKQHNHDH